MFLPFVFSFTLERINCVKLYFDDAIKFFYELIIEMIKVVQLVSFPHVRYNKKLFSVCWIIE